jgi:ribosomal protein S18 acetylase RimI-like enzyme
MTMIDGTCPQTERALTLRTATDGDVSTLRCVLAAAFHEDPLFKWLMSDETTRQARLRRFFELQLRHVALRLGCVWTSSALSGAALCLAPGSWRLPTRVLLRQGPSFARAFGARLPRAAGLLSVLERRHLREPHYYFGYVGVSPDIQGQGLGTALMQPTLDRCDAKGLPAYLEATSERNAALYERLGFEFKDELRFAGSPPLRLMLRPPQTRR